MDNKSIKNTTIITIVMIISSGFHGISFASQAEDSVKKKLIENSSPSFVENVSKSDVGDIFEVMTPKGIAYTDKTASFLIFGGTVIDIKKNINITEKRNRELNSARFKTFPISDAIKIVHGTGLRKIITFEDPNCGYCKKLASEFQKVDNITVYTFILPILSENSEQKAKAIWCSQDRNKAWKKYMLSNVMPKEFKNCETPFERNLLVAKKYGIHGTPAIYFQSGVFMPGAMSNEAINAQLNKE
jgi:thiol:disulfide interchange protein DsbC